MLKTYKLIGIFPWREHLASALAKIEALKPKTLACHHGSVIDSRLEPYFRALRENDVTDLTEWNPMRGY